MSDKIAKKDIVRTNHLGQRVVVVPKGQPIPEGLELSKSEGDATTKKASAPLENKAATGRPTPKATR